MQSRVNFYCTFDSFPISRGSRCLGLSHYITPKRFHLLNINGRYYIYIIGVTIGGHTYGQREELQFDFSVAGSHRHRLQQHTHTNTHVRACEVFSHSQHTQQHITHSPSRSDNPMRRPKSNGKNRRQLLGRLGNTVFGSFLRANVKRMGQC